MAIICRSKLKYWNEFEKEDKGYVKRGQGNKGGKYKKSYKNLICAFDIETTLVEREQYDSVLYLWSFQYDEFCTYIGRTWEEYKKFLKLVTEDMVKGEYIVVYVHNLSYEFQFLKAHFSFQEVFALDERKVLTCESDNIEYRCSYKYSNFNLKEWSNRLNIKHKKLSGEKFDYNKKRYYYTKLKLHELGYSANDVRAVVECLSLEMEVDKDNLYSIPLTSTGKVRRDIKKSLEMVPKWALKAVHPEYNIYTLLRSAFRGGNTHANRYYTGLIIKDVKSRDEESSYPFEMTTSKYPIDPFIKEELSFRRLNKLIEHDRSIIMKIRFKNIELRDKYWGCPYLSVDKSNILIDEERDNGRIIKASILETVITDIDFKIIFEEYKFDDINIIEMYSSNYDYLPSSVVNTIQRYFVNKTELKNVKGEEVMYMKSKAKICSIYGLAAQKPQHEQYEFEDDVIKFIGLENWEECKPLLPYQWGCWCTAHAREHLEEGIKIAGDNFIYTDTDSVKYISDKTTENKFEQLNKERKNISKDRKSTALDIKKEIHYMGIFVDEGIYDKFVTWGAKKYAVEQNGQLYITVAGVQKKKGAIELLNKGGLEVFKPGFIFEESGGVEAHYNDYGHQKLKILNEDKRYIEITSNVALVNHQYEMGITTDYEELISKYQMLKKEKY